MHAALLDLHPTITLPTAYAYSVMAPGLLKPVPLQHVAMAQCQIRINAVSLSLPRTHECTVAARRLGRSAAHAPLFWSSLAI